MPETDEKLEKLIAEIRESAKDAREKKANGKGSAEWNYLSGGVTDGKVGIVKNIK